MTLQNKIRLLDLLELQERNNSRRYLQLGHCLKSRIEHHLFLILRVQNPTSSALIPAQEEKGNVEVLM